jgi:hypothetical protein
MQFSLDSLSPYDNYQLEFTPIIGGVSTNLGSPFSSTSTSNTLHLSVSGDAGFFRVVYLP